jgi:RecA-family ATPase
MKNEQRTGTDTKFDEGDPVNPEEAEAKARAKGERDRSSESAKNGVRQPYQLRGSSLFSYSVRSINPGESLFNNRWLCRGCGAFIIAPSGQGKSVLAAQASACFACGLSAFGLKSEKMPLSSVIIQAEDIEGDLIEMSQVVNHLGLSDAQKVLVDSHTWIETVNNVRGKRFIEILDDILTARPVDLVWINPYAVYLGAPIRDDEANNQFLYEFLNPILEKHQCGTLIPAHTPKTQFQNKEKFKPTDWQYSGAGAAVMTQWARAMIVIDPTEVSGVYRFVAAKRQGRLGWPDNELYFAHSPEKGKLLWVEATPEQEKAAKPKKKGVKKIDLEAVLELVPLLDPELKVKVEARIREKLNIGRDLAKEALQILEAEARIFSHPMPETGMIGKKGARPQGWARTPPVNDDDE